MILNLTLHRRNRLGVVIVEKDERVQISQPTMHPKDTKLRLPSACNLLLAWPILLRYYTFDGMPSLVLLSLYREQPV